MKPATPRKSLTKSQLATASGIELLEILKQATADGRLDEPEIRSLSAWLSSRSDANMPGAKHLREIASRVLEDGVISPEEAREMHEEIERVLPPELRRDAIAKRRAVEAEERAALKRRVEEELAQLRSQRAAELEIELANRPEMTFDFLVAGVAHEGRRYRVEEVIDGIEDRRVTLRRDRFNPYDSNAIHVYIDGLEVGYVPRDDASEMAPLLDSGQKYSAYVKKTWDACQYPVPVIVASIYPSGSPAVGCEVDYVGSKHGGKEVAVLVLILVVIAMFAIAAFRS